MPDSQKFTLSDVLWLVVTWFVLIAVGALSWALVIHLFNWFYRLLS